MSSPSIIPNDRLDRDIYLVLEDFRSGSAWRETDEADTDVSTVVEGLLTGQYDQPLRVVVFNPVERWSRDATEEIAEELDRRISAEGREVSEEASVAEACEVTVNAQQPFESDGADQYREVWKTWEILRWEVIEIVKLPGTQPLTIPYHDNCFFRFVL